MVGCPGTPNCSVAYFEQDIDHFNWAAPLGGNRTTYLQRYFTNDQWWSPGGPIFFYFGNEDNVELYVNHTGLMWESAEEFGAMLVFAEHRYYGESLPFPGGTHGCMSWLTTEQALADFAHLIDHLQDQHAGESGRLPVVGFGGSYGGMMAAWFRMKYPQWVDGVIAASAPIWSFSGLSPAYDYNVYYASVTFDASAAGGASDRCRRNLKAAWPRVIQAGQSEEGREMLARAFRTCSKVRPRGDGSDDPLAIVDWAAAAWSTMAMGNYPYPSNYLMHGSSVLPAWPVRAACGHLDAEFADDESLFEAVRSAAATLYNNTGEASCFDFDSPALQASTMRSHARLQSRRALGLRTQRSSPDACVGDWDYHWCTEIVQPFTQGTPQDMYYCPTAPEYPEQNCSFWDFEAAAAQCESTWGVRPRKSWARTALASKRVGPTSNIVFSNGLQDPWHGGGVLQGWSDSVVAAIIPNGAHHIDLMFSDPVDAKYPDILAARELEVQHMHRWVAAARRARDRDRRPPSEIELAV